MPCWVRGARGEEDVLDKLTQPHWMRNTENAVEQVKDLFTNTIHCETLVDPPRSFFRDERKLNIFLHVCSPQDQKNLMSKDLCDSVVRKTLPKLKANQDAFHAIDLPCWVFDEHPRKNRHNQEL